MNFSAYPSFWRISCYTTCRPSWSTRRNYPWSDQHLRRIFLFRKYTRRAFTIYPESWETQSIWKVPGLSKQMYMISNCMWTAYWDSTKECTWRPLTWTFHWDPSISIWEISWMMMNCPTSWTRWDHFIKLPIVSGWFVI